MSPLNTLLVEDNHFFRESFKKILNDRFPTMKIIEAENGKEALNRYREFAPDLVFIDINLPDRNGFEISKIIRLEKSRCVIFFLTSYDLPEYRQAAFKNGADFFFSKDCKPEEIFTALESIPGLWGTSYEPAPPT
ncbi:MAG: response regulator transcription factor [Deltaproteobacteria bacterium]|nr:response regulator transcription factor [Deltaproteobacteria bacterium]